MRADGQRPFCGGCRTDDLARLKKYSGLLIHICTRAHPCVEGCRTNVAV